MLALDLIGTFTFALTGALAAVRKDMDVFGVLVLATVTGIGGGVIRDLLLGYTPPAAIRDSYYVVLCCMAGLLVFFLHERITQVAVIPVAIRVLDAIGVGVFAAIGSTKALSLGSSGLVAILMGILTAAGGGTVRDLLAGEIPSVLREEVYALAAALGAAFIVVGSVVGLIGPVWTYVGAALGIAARLLAMHFAWQAPHPSGSKRQ